MRLPALLLYPLLLSAGAPAPIFNGKDLGGWVHEGPRPTFSALEGELRTSGRGNAPNWLRTAREYENFRLEFEYNLSQWAEAAVVLRAPRWGRPARAGIAIVLAHDFHGVAGDYVTGAVAGAAPPLEPLPASFGDWRRIGILLDGDRLVVFINDRLVQDLDISTHPELRHRLKRGYIGFPDLGHKYSLRNVRLEDLGFRREYVTLFDGSSLKGWDLRGGGAWAVRDGAIHGANGHGILYAEPVFADFELTLQIRSHQRANGGVFLRGSPALNYRGFEVQIYSPLDSVYPTGSIYGIQRSLTAAELEDRWFLLQVLVEGARCLVRIDGETVAEAARLPDTALRPGRLGLQIHMYDAALEFTDIRVRPL